MNRYLRKFLYLTYAFLNPLAYGLQHFSFYLSIAEQISLYHNVHYRAIWHAVNVLLALKAVHFVYLTLYSGTTPLDITVQFDAIFLFTHKLALNAIAAFGTVIICYYSFVLFRRLNLALLSGLKQVMLHHKWIGHFIGSKSCQKSRKLVCDQIRTTYLVTNRIFLSVVYLSGKWQRQCL